MIKQSIQIIKNMGLRYTCYRVKHEVEKRLGILRKKHPVNPPVQRFISLAAWKMNTPLFVIPEREELFFPKNPTSVLKDQKNKILNGEICFFSHVWKMLGKDYDWVTNPDNGYRYDSSKHWSEIEDYNPQSGDIKFVWEKSRFSYLLTLIRNDYHFDEDHSAFVFSEIEHWIDANPVNQGPNWRCSQETSLRLFNWCYALYFYKNSTALTEALWKKIQQVIYWSLHHVYHHIDFSRIAVRNNHALTETLMLALSGLLFPFIPETKDWSRKGRKWFEEEIAYQIYEDGTFLQFSMNYHRVALQLLTLGITLTEKHHQPFSEKVYDRAYASLKFLFACQDKTTGWLPNYGSNDGALFFALNSCDYRDYRPQLNALHVLLTGEALYQNKGVWKEDVFWWNTKPVGVYCGRPLLHQEGWSSFEKGGYYVLREQDTLTFVRCGKHKDRPAQADNLHLDIWHKGENVLFDGGSYKYNTDAATLNYFMGTQSHNTVMIEQADQMLKGARFIWLNWSQASKARVAGDQGEYYFEGEISAFRNIHPKIRHIRRIKKKKNEPVWIVEDTFIGKPEEKELRQYWHSLPQIHFLSKDENGSPIFPQKGKGSKSDYYGSKEEAIEWLVATPTNEITTTITVA